MNDNAPVTVKAETLISFIQGNKAIKPYEGLIIAGDLNLADLTYDHKLTLRKCIFQGHVDATDCHFKKTVDLAGSTFEKGITFAGAYVDHLIAPGCTFKGPFAANEVRFDQSVDLSACVFAGSVQFQGSRVAGNLLLADSTIQGPEANFELVTIEGNLSAAGLQAQTTLDFTNSSVRGKTDFSRGKQTTKCRGDLNCYGANFSGVVNLNEAEILGSLYLGEAEIQGSLLCNGLQIRPAFPGAYCCASLWGLKVSGSVGFAKARIEGGMDLPGSEIRGGLYCDGAEIDGIVQMQSVKIRTIVKFTDARIGSSLNMGWADVEGEVDLEKADISGSFYMGEGKIQGSLKGSGLHLRKKPEENSTADAYLRGLRVSGGVSFSNAAIDGGMVLSCAEFQGGLYFDGATIQGSLQLQSAKIRTLAKFTDARLGSSLNMGWAEVEGEVDLEKADIEGSFFLSEGKIQGSLKGSGLRLRKKPEENSTADVYLRGLRVTGSVSFSNAAIDGGMILSCAEFQGGLYCDGATVQGSLQLQTAKIRTLAKFTDAHLGSSLNMGWAEVEGEVDMEKAEVAGNLYLGEGKIQGSLKGNGIRLHKNEKENANGDASLWGLYVSGAVGFDNALIEGEFNLQGVEIAAGLYCNNSEIQGLVKMPSAKIRGLYFSNARVGASYGMVAATVEGDMILNDLQVGEVYLDGLRVTKDTRIERAQIRGNLQLPGAKIDGSLFLYESRVGQMLDLANAEVTGNLHFFSRVTDQEAAVGGTAWLSGVKIGGAADFNGLVVGSELNLTSAVIKECLALNPDRLERPTKVQGDVDFSAAKVSGPVKLDRLQVTGQLKGTAVTISSGLSCPEAQVGGPVNMSSTTVFGSMDFSKARIGGQSVFAQINVDGDVNFQGAVIAGDLNLKDASVQGELVCRDMQVAAPKDPENPQEANASLTGIKVTGDIDFSGAKVENRLALDRAAIDGRLRFSFRADPPTQVGGRLLLNACSVRHADFAHQPDGHKPATTSKLPKFDLQGFQFQELDVPEKNYIRFLARTDPFRQTSYVLIEQWLRNRGKDKEAENIFFAMRDRSNKEAMANRSAARKFINRIWRRTSRLFLFVAFRSFFLVLLALGLLGLTAFVFSDPRSVQSRDEGVVGNPDSWDVVKSVRLAMNIHFPGAPISLLDHWEPSNAVLWRCDLIPGCPFNVTYQDYAHAAWWVTYIAVLPLLGIGFLIKWSRRRAAESPG